MNSPGRRHGGLNLRSPAAAEGGRKLEVVVNGEIATAEGPGTTTDTRVAATAVVADVSKDLPELIDCPSHRSTIDFHHRVRDGP